MTPRENLFAVYKHEKPEYIPADGPFDFIPAAGEHYEDERFVGATGLDWFGVSWTYTETAPGDVAATVSPVPPRLQSLGDWEKEGVIPTKEKIDSFDWKRHCDFFTQHWDRENNISTCFCPSGFFERMHHLLGFEQALLTFYTEPEVIHGFLDALLEFKKRTISKLYEYARPDVLIFFDDYGNARNLFFGKPMWDEYFAPRLREIVAHVHSLGMLFEMHSCGYITPLVGDMVDMGIDILQPLQAMNDVAGIKAAYGSRLVIHGGITASEMTTEEESRMKIRKCVETLTPGNNFIPIISECFTNREMVDRLFREELARLGWDYR